MVAEDFHRWLSVRIEGWLEGQVFQAQAFEESRQGSHQVTKGQVIVCNQPLDLSRGQYAHCTEPIDLVELAQVSRIT